MNKEQYYNLSLYRTFRSPQHTPKSPLTPTLFADASPQLKGNTGTDECSCNTWRLEAHTSTPEGDVSFPVTTSSLQQTTPPSLLQSWTQLVF